MPALIKMLIKNLVTMLITEKMIIWSLEVAAKYTDNKVDDNIVLIVKGAYKSDTEMIKKGIEGLMDKA